MLLCDVKVVRIAKNISRNALRSLQVKLVDDVERLFAITHEGVTIYSLPDLQLKAQAYKSSGATCCAWREVPRDTNGDDAPVSDPTSDWQLLVFGKRRRITLCAYNAHDLQYVNEMGLSEDVVAMTWCGNYVCVETRRSLVFADPRSKTTAQLLSWRKDAVTQLLQITLTQSLFQMDTDIWYISSSTGRSQAPWTLPRAPSALIHAHPFLLAAFSDSIEVYAAAEASLHPMLQRIEMSALGMNVGESAGGLFFCSWGKASVLVTSRLKAHTCLLEAAPLSEQVVAIAEAGLAQEALLLCQHEGLSECRSLKDGLHIRYGVALFVQVRGTRVPLPVIIFRMGIG